MILIYSEEITSRLEYTARLIFTGILKIEVSFTTNSAKFKASESPKINYSNEKFGNAFFLKPHRLLFCKALISPAFKPVWYNGEKYFFESSPDSDLPFDPLAATFYLVTRYEEYFETEQDRHNRFKAEKSLLFKNGLLEKPVVNSWADLLAEKLSARFPELVFPERKFKFLSTIDIDNAWAYKHKGPWRSSGALAKALARGNSDEWKNRLNVLFGKEPDPYDTFPFLNKLFEGNEKNVRFFFLLGDYAHYDKNISHRNKYFKKLIQATAKKYDVGIHPSYLSSKKNGLKRVHTEKRRLEKITGNPIEKSRQHFLRLQFPKTYRRLIKTGITEDYTMGFASQPGFRAGICTPYFFYDLKKEKQTKLKIIPFQVMDVTLQHYLALSPDEAWKKTEQLMQEVKKVRGTFVSVWHNETVTDKDGWEGFREIFIKMNKKGFEWANE
ncbi:MAG: polysaccharide deacetylase family protein [Prolixibacteraceae bacterium]|nr:polysaccharide deacetylase family protein [Prolixibacteraceae bacterium]